MAFARRNRDYRYSMPKKAVRIAIRMALLSKFQDRQAIVLDGLTLNQPKTREVAKVLRAIRRPDLTRGRGGRVGRRDQGQGTEADPRPALDLVRPSRP